LESGHSSAFSEWPEGGREEHGAKVASLVTVLVIMCVVFHLQCGGDSAEPEILDAMHNSCGVGPQNNVTLLMCYTVVSLKLFQLDTNRPVP
jgi:hypothetical protein